MENKQDYCVDYQHHTDTELAQDVVSLVDDLREVDAILLELDIAHNMFDSTATLLHNIAVGESTISDFDASRMIASSSDNITVETIEAGMEGLGKSISNAFAKAWERITRILGKLVSIFDTYETRWKKLHSEVSKKGTSGWKVEGGEYLVSDADVYDKISNLLKRIEPAFNKISTFRKRYERKDPDIRALIALNKKFGKTKHRLLETKKFESVGDPDSVLRDLDNDARKLFELNGRIRAMRKTAKSTLRKLHATHGGIFAVTTIGAPAITAAAVAGSVSVADMINTKRRGLSTTSRYCTMFGMIIAREIAQYTHIVKNMKVND